MAGQLAGTMTVRFSGARGGRHPLTWGQRDVYRGFLVHSPHAAFFNVRVSVPVPPGTTADQVCDAVRRTVEDHESLRTTYRTDGSGRPYQVVQRDGVIAVPTVDVPPGEFDPHGPWAHLGGEFDHAAELALRCVLVTSAGSPAWLVTEVSHLSADTAGGRILRRALARRLNGEPVPGRVHQAADQIAEESSPSGLDLGGRAISYLGSVLDAVPVPVFGAPEGEPPSDRPRAVMTSPALGAAVAMLSHRHRVTAGPVYLTLTALLIAALSGREAFAFSVVASNRWIPGADVYIGTLNQYAVGAIDLAGADLPTALSRAQAAGLRAFRYGLFDIDALAADGYLDALDRVDCVLNNNQTSQAPVPELPAETPAALLARTTIIDQPPFRPTPPPFRRSIQLSINGTGERPELTLIIERRVLPGIDPGRVLRAVEAVAVSAAEATEVPNPVALMTAALPDPALSPTSPGGPS